MLVKQTAWKRSVEQTGQLVFHPDRLAAHHQILLHCSASQLPTAIY